MKGGGSWLYRLVLAVWWLLSLPPLWFHYGVSDVVLFPLLYWVLRYRRCLVRRQLAESLPELSEGERLGVERRFYHTLCDYFVETLKMASMSSGELRRRVKFIGVDELQRLMKGRGKYIGLTCLGHFGNWEWMSSANMEMEQGVSFSQVYHTLHSPIFDRLMTHSRERCGGQCVSMQDTLRHILRTESEGRYEIVGLIADQCPKWEAMHQWCTFLHHETSFFIGAEAIGKRVDGIVSYLDISRPSRGHYRAEIKVIATSPREFDDYEITLRYAQLLEASIRRDPHLWLWTHDRWKRTREEWERRRGG